MTESGVTRKELLEEIVNRNKLGVKKFHSESSLQHFGEDENEINPDTDIEANKDPGVHNNHTSANTTPSAELSQARRRTMSQPGPVSGGMLTATAARAARRKPLRNVNYPDDIERTDSERQIPRLIIPKGDDSGSTTPTGNSFVYNSINRNGDSKSLNSYRLYAQNDRGGTTPRKRSMAMDVQSIRSTETQAPPPTSLEDNRRLTMKYFTLVASTIYAILLVTLGFLVHIADPFTSYPISPSYALVLSGLGMLYIIYLIIDINRYKKLALNNQKIKSRYEETVAEYFRKHEEEYSINEEDRSPNYRPLSLPPPVLSPLKHDYCFSQGRHSGSFYLKLGAAGFALGSLVHSVLLIAVQIGAMFDEDVDNNECVEFVQVSQDFVYPFYCFLQLYFIFKYSNVIILRGQAIANFAFMHMIGSSLCFWIQSIVRETVLGLTLYAQTVGDDYSITNSSTTSANTGYDLGKFGRVDLGSLYNENCTGSEALSALFESYSPYLYPFSVEFNILIVAVYYIIWSNIGHCHNEDNSDSEITSNDGTSYLICKIPTANEDNDYTSNLVIYADCHASNKGLFLGLIVIVIITGMLIIGFVFSSLGGDYVSIGYSVNDITKLSLHIVILFAAITALFQTKRLDINEHSISLLDDILLYICLPPFFMETVLSLLATLTILNIVKSIDFVVMVIQVLIQTPLIMDGLRRCSNTRKLRRSKPGREVIMFLIISNVSMWLFYTFSYKSPNSLDERYEFYGKVLWSILGHISLPLIMFYRFHSSVCFADIWNSAYKPGAEH